MARRTRPLLLLGLALVTGGLAATLALRYLRQQATPVVVPQVRHGQIVVAARPLPVGSMVGEKDVRTVDWSGGAVPPGFLTSPADAVGRGVIMPLSQDEPLMTSKLAPKGAGGGLPVM